MDPWNCAIYKKWESVVLSRWNWNTCFAVVQCKQLLLKYWDSLRWIGIHLIYILNCRQLSIHPIHWHKWATCCVINLNRHLIIGCSFKIMKSMKRTYWKRIGRNVRQPWLFLGGEGVCRLEKRNADGALV